MKLGSMMNPIQPANLLQTAVSVASKLQQSSKIGNLAGIQIKKAADPGESPVNNLTKAADKIKELESKINELTGMLQKLMEQMQNATQQQQNPSAQRNLQSQPMGDDPQKVEGASKAGNKIGGINAGQPTGEKSPTQELSKQVENLANQVRDLMDKLQQEQKVKQKQSVELNQQAQEATTKVQPGQQTGGTGLGMAMSTSSGMR